MDKSDYYFRTTDFAVGYDGKSVVSDININIKKGEILTLVGPNGSGKTTIIKSIIRQLEPVTGVAYIDNESIFMKDKGSLAKELAVVLTDRPKTEMMTVRDVVETGRYPYTGRFGILTSADRDIVEKAISLIGVEEIAARDFMKISDGQRQRVMLARAIAQEPEIIILDEPTSFLDIKHKLEFLSVLYRLSRQRNLTVVMSLHEVELARKISDQVACVKDGKLDRGGAPEEFMTDEYIRELFDIKIDEIIECLR